MAAATDLPAPSLSRPFPGSFSTLRGRDAYFAENGFSEAVYDAPFTNATLLGLDFRVPNTKRHRWAIMRHDLHHVATGYGTDFVGEVEVSAWECRRGLRPLGLYTGGIVAGLTLVGLLFAPRRTLAAWRASASPVRDSLFHDHRVYEALTDSTVAELRERLGIPPGGLTGARRLHPRAPGVEAWCPET